MRNISHKNYKKKEIYKLFLSLSLKPFMRTFLLTCYNILNLITNQEETPYKNTKGDEVLCLTVLIIDIAVCHLFYSPCFHLSYISLYYQPPLTFYKISFFHLFINRTSYFQDFHIKTSNIKIHINL